MKILIFSDNHGDRDNIERIIKKHEPLDRIISLGDSEMREFELSNLEIIGVKGNYPFEPKFPYELSFSFSGVSVYFTHGHHYHVKMGLTKLLQKAYYEKYNIVCFGHTHQVYLEEVMDIILVNPGALSFSRSHQNPSYGIIDIDDEKISVLIYNVYGNKLKSLTKKRKDNEFK